MPVWLSFILAVLATVGFFGTLFGVAVGLVEARRAKAKPSLGVAPGDRPGTLTLWATWDPKVFDVQVYRFRVTFVSPEYKVREGMFIYTFEPPAKVPFSVSVELPQNFRELLEVGERAKNALITFELKTVQELTILSSYGLDKLRKIYHGKGGSVPSSLTALKPATPDVPTTMTLDYEELTVRRKKLRDLEAAAKAKAAKPAPAAKPATAAAPAPAAAPADKPA